MTEHEDTEPNEDYTLKSGEVYTLRLFITGASPNSSRAIANLKVICEDHLKGN